MNSIEIFSAVVGSVAYGTNTPESDIDLKSIYVQHPNEILGFGYKEQTDINKDNVGYEIKRFIQLLSTGNPNINELLWIPDKHIRNIHPAFEYIREYRVEFLTRSCYTAYKGYAYQQIQKAGGLNKKANMERDKVTKKELLDFIYFIKGNNTIAIKSYLKQLGYQEKNCGLINLDHAKNVYAIYHNPDLNYKGISSPTSNMVKLSSIPKEEIPFGIVHVNHEGYSSYSKDYREYMEWLENRNTTRYVEDKNHGQFLNGKNLLHLRRLLDMAKEIATERKIIVERPNADYLLKIRRGEVNLSEIIEQAEIDIKELNKIFDESSLPDKVDKYLMQEILLKARTMVEF